MEWKIRVLIPPPEETVTGSEGKTNKTNQNSEVDSTTQTLAQNATQELVTHQKHHERTGWGLAPATELLGQKRVKSLLSTRTARPSRSTGCMHELLQTRYSAA